MAFDLERFRVRCALGELFYVPDYVSEAEEASLLTQVSASKAAWRQASVCDVVCAAHAPAAAHTKKATTNDRCPADGCRITAARWRPRA